MSWAQRRRAIILSLIGAVVLAFVAIIVVAVVYKAPSCSDGVQNQGEAGVDCGGPCPLLCTSQAHTPVVLYTIPISNGVGRTDVVASIENTNPTAAAKNVPYAITLYGAGQVFVQQVTGMLDLPPASSVPVFVPGIPSGSQTTLHAFLTLTGTPQWYAVQGDPRIKPVVTNTVLAGATSTPRINATLSNAAITPIRDVRIIAVVHDTTGNVIAASQTIVPVIPAQGEATATFTWNAPFPSAPAAIEVLPVIPLP